MRIARPLPSFALALLLCLWAAPAYAQEGTEAYSTDETRRLYQAWQQSAAEVDRLQAEEEACQDDPSCPYSTIDGINGEQGRASDNAERAAEDLVQEKLELMREAPAERPPDAESKLDALQALEDFSTQELGTWIASDTTQAARDERQAAEAQIAEAQAPAEEEPAQEPESAGAAPAPEETEDRSIIGVLIGGIFGLIWWFVKTAFVLFIFLVLPLLVVGVPIYLGLKALGIIGGAGVGGRMAAPILARIGRAAKSYLLGRLEAQQPAGPQPTPPPPPADEPQPGPAGPRPATDPPQGDDWMFGGDGNGRREPSQQPKQETEEQKRQRLLNLETILHEKIVGQEAAISAVASSVRRREAGGFGGERPASFLFMGPTGVGKTEVAKVLTDEIYGGADVRLDMSEYQESHTVSRLYGSPPGYHGHDEGGQLTNAMLEDARRLVLLDEIEKAHPDVWTAFLGVLDDGRLTDNKGRTADFGQATVVMTSNLLAEEIRQVYESGREMDERAVKNELVQRGIKRELVNRIGRIVFFHPLRPEDVREIARRLLAKTIRQMREKHGVEVGFTDAAVALLADWGYEPENGSRPLRGVIETEVEDRLSDLLLRGKIGKGSAIEFDLRAEDDGAHVLGVRARAHAGDREE